MSEPSANQNPNPAPRCSAPIVQIHPTKHDYYDAEIDRFLEELERAIDGFAQALKSSTERGEELARLREELKRTQVDYNVARDAHDGARMERDRIDVDLAKYRSALRVACEEIRQWRARDEAMRSVGADPYPWPDLTMAADATDAAIDLATATPKERES